MGCASLLDGFLDIDRQQHREHDGLDQAEQQAQHLHEQRQHEQRDHHNHIAYGRARA